MSDTFDHEWDEFCPMDEHYHYAVDDYPIQKTVPMKSIRTICKYCGETNLFWSKKNGKWRLIDKKSKEAHTCKEYTNLKNK